MQVQGQNELVETLCRRIHTMEQDYAALSAASAAAGIDLANPTAAAAAAAAVDEAGSSGGGGGDGGDRVDGADPGTGRQGDGNTAGGPGSGAAAPARRRASTGPTLSDQPYNFGSGPGLLRRMSSISIAGGMAAGVAGDGFRRYLRAYGEHRHVGPEQLGACRACSFGIQSA